MGGYVGLCGGEEEEEEVRWRAPPAAVRRPRGPCEAALGPNLKSAPRAQRALKSALKSGYQRPLLCALKTKLLRALKPIYACVMDISAEICTSLLYALTDSLLNALMRS